MSALSSTQRLILLCALALGVILMHHVSTPGAALGTVETVAEHTEQSPQHHACPPCEAHVMTHVCLAVLDGTAQTLPVLLMFLGFATNRRDCSPGRGSPPSGRPPDPHGRTILTSLCVLRV